MITATLEPISAAFMAFFLLGEVLGPSRWRGGSWSSPPSSCSSWAGSSTPWPPTKSADIILDMPTALSILPSPNEPRLGPVPGKGTGPDFFFPAIPERPGPGKGAKEGRKEQGAGRKAPSRRIGNVFFSEGAQWNMKISKVLLIAVMCLAVMVSSAFAADKKPVVIGLQGPITGPWAYEGQMAKQSCEIAASLINKKGGILGGRMVEVRVVDDAGEPKTGALAAQKLVGQKDVVASVSTYGSSVCETASTIYEKYKKVNIGYGVPAVRLTQRNFKYFFRTCGRDDSQGRFFADAVPAKFNARKIAIMHDNTAFGKGLAEDTKKALEPMIKDGKVEIVYFDAVTPGEKDFRVPLTQLRETKPDVWYYTGTTPRRPSCSPRPGKSGSPVPSSAATRRSTTNS